jgi:hypothetical protein
VNAAERTPQQLDPAGSIGSRTLTRLLMFATLGYSVVVTLVSSNEIHTVWLAVVSLLLLASAVTVVLIQSRPERAPLRRMTLVVALGLMLLATVASAASSWKFNSFVGDDWPPIALGALLLAIGPYRPSRELAVGGIVSAVIVGVTVYLQVPWLASADPPSAFIVVSIAPLLALSFGSVAYSRASIAAVERGKDRIVDEDPTATRTLEVGIARAVQQDRVTILSRDVLPFFGEVLARGELTDADRERAREIAESIRGVMVADVDRSWLEGVVEVIAPAAVVDDSERLAVFVSTEGRTALRTLLVAIVESYEFDSGQLRIELFSDGHLCSGVVMARLAPELAPRVDFAPYFALLRATFRAFDFEIHHSDLIVRFSYDQQ